MGCINCRSGQLEELVRCITTSSLLGSGLLTMLDSEGEQIKDCATILMAKNRTTAFEIDGHFAISCSRRHVNIHCFALYRNSYIYCVSKAENLLCTGKVNLFSDGSVPTTKF